MPEEFVDKFAPLPVNDTQTWDTFRVSLLEIGTLSAAAPFFDSSIKSRSYFLYEASKDPSQSDRSKNTTLALMRPLMAIAKENVTIDDSTPLIDKATQYSFPEYVASTPRGWGRATSDAVRKLFSGTDDQLDILRNVLADGKLIAGGLENLTSKAPQTMGFFTLQDNVLKTIFAMAIPELW